MPVGLNMNIITVADAACHAKLLMACSAKGNSVTIHQLTYDVMCIRQSAGECDLSLRYAMRRQE